MKLRFFEDFDYILFFCMVVLITMGISFIYSSGVTTAGISVSNEYVKQIVWGSTGILLMLVVAIYDYRQTRRYAKYLYIFLFLILVYTRLWGKYVNGARSWLGIGSFGLQPSEFCKIFFILYLAYFLENSRNENQKKRFFKAGAIMALPVCLILVQPDMGTASAYIPIFLGMCLVAGFPLRYTAMFFFAGAFTILFTVLPIWQADIAKHTYTVISVLTNLKLRLLVIIGLGLVTIISVFGKLYFPNNKYYYWTAYVSGIFFIAMILSYGASKVLKDYQLMRLIIYLDPQVDPLGAGWNINQSKIAIGSGGVWGRGFLNGTQSHYRFLPQQSTDFIFSILSEELGFAGGTLVFSLYFVIFLRCIYIMRVIKNEYGYYIATGILSLFFYHFIINVGMVMGIMPITGIPLLFLSYGGSSLWTAMICIGLLMSINYRKMDFAE